MRHLILLMLAFSLSSLARADEMDEFSRLQDAMRTQVICLDLVEGSVGAGQQKPATRKFFSALVASIRSYVSLATESGVQDLIVIRQYVGSDEILVGVILGGMLSDDADLQREKDQLRQGRSIPELNRILWQRHGCDTLYRSL